LLNANPLENIAATNNRRRYAARQMFIQARRINGSTRSHRECTAVSKQKKKPRRCRRKTWRQVEWNSEGEVVKVDLNNTRVTDADLAILEKFPGLQWLDLRITPVTDEGVAHVRTLRKLKFLNLFRTNLSDKGMENVRGLIELETLLIGGTKVTDAGLANIERLPRLRKVSVFRTAVSDAGLPSLVKLPSLESFSSANQRSPNRARKRRFRR
jgi:hypothetical protein